jgi:hypothetical protein
MLTMAVLQGLISLFPKKLLDYALGIKLLATEFEAQNQAEYNRLAKMELEEKRMTEPPFIHQQSKDRVPWSITQGYPVRPDRDKTHAMKDFSCNV